MQRVTGHVDVRTGHDDDALLVKLCEERDVFSERRLPLRLERRRDAAERRDELAREGRDAGLALRVLRLGVQPLFVERERVVDHHVVCHERRELVLHGGRRQIDRREPLERFLTREPLPLLLRERGVEQVVDVTDRVVPGVDRLLRRHVEGDVPDGTHAVRVGIGDDRLHERRIDARVDLHVDAAGLLEHVDRRSDVLLLLDRHGAERSAPAPVDDSLDEHARAEPLPGVDRVANAGDEPHDVAEVAHRGHAGGEIDEPLLHLLDVRVHVPKPRDD